MKKYIYSMIALFTATLCSAQMFVSQAEYFWDTDPGVGNGTAFSAADGTFNSAFEQLTRTGVTLPSVGLHKFCIRIKDNTGQWGPVFMNIIEVQQTTNTAIMAIAQAEYFWDNDPGVGLGMPFLAIDGNFDSAFEQLYRTSVVLPTNGLHVFNIRIKDNTGVWGPVFRNVINVQNSLDISDSEMRKLVAYPNPVNDVLNVSFDSAITNITIHNLLGQQVLSKSINANEGTIDVSNLNSGTYFVKAQVEGRAQTIKIIKQ